MTVPFMGKLHQLRRSNRDWLLTLLTVVLAFMTFVFAPLQAAGIFLFQTFAIAGLLVIVGGALIISGNPFAFGLMSIVRVPGREARIHARPSCKRKSRERSSALHQDQLQNPLRL